MKMQNRWCRSAELCIPPQIHLRNVCPEAVVMNLVKANISNCYKLTEDIQDSVDGVVVIRVRNVIVYAKIFVIL